jgi:hypothetical protein
VLIKNDVIQGLYHQGVVLPENYMLYIPQFSPSTEGAILTDMEKTEHYCRIEYLSAISEAETNAAIELQLKKGWIGYEDACLIILAITRGLPLFLHDEVLRDICTEMGIATIEIEHIAGRGP